MISGIIGVGYNHGHSVLCPKCKDEEWIEVRERKNSRIKDKIQCPKCKSEYAIVVPEDPERKMTNEDLKCFGSGGLRVLRRKYFEANPAVLKC